MTPSGLTLSAWFVDLVLPRRCVSCGTPASALCHDCLGALRPLRPPRCALCGAPTAWPVERCRECAGRRIAFTRAMSGYAYAGPVRPFVRAWKEHGLRHLAAVAVDLLAVRMDSPTADVVMPVAPDRLRQLSRGGRHPAEALARGLARRFDLPYEALLARAPGSRRQRGLQLPERRANVRGAFRTLRPVPSSVLLVDDVYTTGATVNAAATALRQAGASRIEVVTFARAAR